MIMKGEDVRILGLHFQTLSGEPLIKGGSEIPVCNDNALTYIYLLAKVFVL